jgi:hypothetical protein
VTPAALLADLVARGVRVERRDEALHVVAPRGVLTAADKAALQAAKPALLRLLADAPNDRHDQSPLILDRVTLRAVLGPRPDPVAVTALETEVRLAIRQYQVEVASGVLGPGPLRVRGRPVSDFLDLDLLGRLIQTRGPRAEDAADG